MSASSHRLVGIAAGAVLFGVLMTARGNASSSWSRILLAALAGAVLGGLLVFARSRGPAGPRG